MFERASDYVAGFLNDDERHAFEQALVKDAELRAEVARCRQHFDTIGRSLQAEDLGVLGNLKREVWGENWMPWRRRIRLWEFALGGIAAALLTFVVYSSPHLNTASSDILRADLQSSDGAFSMEVAIDPVAMIVMLQWQPNPPPEGERFELWGVFGDQKINIAAVQQSPLQRVEITKKHLEVLGVGSSVILTLEDETAVVSSVGAIVARGELHSYPLDLR